eukprot:3200486-Pyramimonas_sp.AAC.1
MKQFSHPSERVNNVWIAQGVRFAELGEDCFFQECSHRYPVQEKLASPMEQWIKVSWVQWGPLQQGEPHRRPRVS